MLCLTIFLGVDQIVLFYGAGILIPQPNDHCDYSRSQVDLGFNDLAPLRTEEKRLSVLEFLEQNPLPYHSISGAYAQFFSIRYATSQDFAFLG